VKPAEVREIQRQKGAVKLLGEGRTADGFDALDGLDTGDCRRRALRQLASDYVQAVGQGRTA